MLHRGTDWQQKTPTDEILMEALGYLEAGWTKGSFARTLDGQVTLPSDPKAVSFCADGAIYRACHANNDLRAMQAARQALSEQTELPLVAWNDTPERTFSQVREVFRRAAFAVGGRRDKVVSNAT